MPLVWSGGRGGIDEGTSTMTAITLTPDSSSHLRVFTRTARELTRTAREAQVAPTVRSFGGSPPPVIGSERLCGLAHAYCFGCGHTGPQDLIRLTEAPRSRSAIGDFRCRCGLCGTITPARIEDVQHYHSLLDDDERRGRFSRRSGRGARRR